MSKLKSRILALGLALSSLLAVLPVKALNAEPAAGSEVSPGDSISYTYTLSEDMENCVLRLSLGPGLAMQENSVRIQSAQTPEVVYGSDGFVLMSDKLEKGDTISFVADVSSAALEIWAKITAGDDSISEEDGYAAHILVLPAHAEDTAVAAQTDEETDTGAPGLLNTRSLFVPLLILMAAALALMLRRWMSFRKAQKEATPGADPSGAAQSQEETLAWDDTVEYLTIPEEKPAKTDE
ncbi:MAG: hypothetical protein EOM66_00710 [Clostridia bacterium]|nr:hypothetical protein [Clostridia bacterium]